jgi:ATP phosphoribosyltransferase regulatory subunit
MMLRPDFTVPVVADAHAEHGAEPARYTYLGEVFRKQEVGSGRRHRNTCRWASSSSTRATRRAPMPRSSRCFPRRCGLGLRAVTGDMGILLAAIESLSTTEARKAALRRHIWRPRRFRALLDRYTGRAPPPEGRAALLDHVARQGLDAVIDAAGVEIGLRSRAEIAARIESCGRMPTPADRAGRGRCAGRDPRRSRPLCPMRCERCAT